ncbi:MAG: hypothetical protein PHY93_06585 [Bacteriovorax sp.]|nr:hypothetical protein [Bacteriovorax sp.]
MKILFLCVSFFGFFNFAQSAETKEFDSSSIKRLEISNPKGEILVVTSPNSKKIIVTIDKIQFDKQCHFNLSSSLGTLKAVVEHEHALFEKANCITKLKIEVPNKVIDIDVSSGSSSIKLMDAQGKVDFSTATGPVEIHGDALKNIEGKTATSNMRISYSKCPTRADINLVTATGDTEIYLPANCKIRVSHKSATGDLFNELGESEDFQVHISSKSASGSLKIKKNQK